MQSQTKNPNDLSKLSKSDLETLGNDLVKQRNATKDPTVRADLRKRIDAVRQAYQAR
jgi:hypothetical protein